MPRISFTNNLQRHVECPTSSVAGATVADALGSFFADNARVRDYVLDDQGAVRKHVVIFIDGKPIADRQRLSDPLAEQSEVFVMQALSGG